MEYTIKMSSQTREYMTMASIIKSALKHGLTDTIRNDVVRIMVNKGANGLVRKIFEVEFKIVTAEDISVTVSVRNHLMRFGFCEVTYWMNDKLQMRDDANLQFVKVFGYKEI